MVRRAEGRGTRGPRGGGGGKVPRGRTGPFLGEGGCSCPGGVFPGPAAKLRWSMKGVGAPGVWACQFMAVRHGGGVSALRAGVHWIGGEGGEVFLIFPDFFSGKGGGGGGAA